MSEASPPLDAPAVSGSESASAANPMDADQSPERKIAVAENEIEIEPPEEIGQKADAEDGDSFHDAVEEAGSSPKTVEVDDTTDDNATEPETVSLVEEDKSGNDSLKSHTPVTNANDNVTKEVDNELPSQEEKELSSNDCENSLTPEPELEFSEPLTPESAVLVSDPEDNDHETARNVSAGAGSEDANANAVTETKVEPSASASEDVSSAAILSFTSQDTHDTRNSTTTHKPIPCYVKKSTPIPNSDSSLRLLRKFISKTSKYFSTAYGGTKGSTLFSFFMGATNRHDESSACYKHLVDILLAGVEESDSDDPDPESEQGEHGHDTDNDNVMIESILGHSGDTMSKARLAIASFCRLMEMWCLDSQRSYIKLNAGIVSQKRYEELFDKTNFYHLDNLDIEDWISQTSAVTGEVMVAALDCAEGLVAHGCVDGVLLGFGHEEDTDALNFSLDASTDSIDDVPEEKNFASAISVLCGSIYTCYLDSEEMELGTLKFLLTTATRTTDIHGGDKGEVETMLKGSFLLQAIRVCYRMYLSTDSAPNKTTAKAALRQIVTGTFKRLELKNESKKGGEDCTDNATTTPTPAVTEGEDPFSHTGYEKEESNLQCTSSQKMDPDDATLKSRISAAGNFPSFEHKDAYLVLRSLCKLSMKAVSKNSEDVQNLASSVLISRNQSSGAKNDVPTNRSSKSTPGQSIMMDPALDSKILSLDLILEILQRTKTETLLNAGPHLIYAVRNYLCHSLLKNCTSDNTFVVNLSLQLFVPLIQHFRAHLKTEIEAFVTNVFFVILDSKNSPVEHKLRVVVLFEEICSDPATLAEIFLNYDCDLSAVDLFQRIVNTLARVAKIGLHDQGLESTGLFIGGTGASRAEKTRQNHRSLRLEAMKAVKKILSSLHSSIDPSMSNRDEPSIDDDQTISSALSNLSQRRNSSMPSQIIAIVKELSADDAGEKKSLVQIYDSKKKRKEDLEKVFLKFNQKPKAGLKLAAQVGFIDEDDPNDVAQFLLSSKDSLDKTQIGEFLGMGADYKDGFTLKVLNYYANAMDFTGLSFDDAIKFYLSGFRLPGEAQKVNFIEIHALC